MGLDSPCSPLSAICLACVYACDDAVVEYIIVGKRLVAFEAFTLKTISRDLILIDLSSVLYSLKDQDPMSTQVKT